MSATSATHYPRTLYEARLDAECYAVSHELHARLFRRFRMWVRIAVTLSGTAAFGGWLAVRPDVAGIAALVVAVLVAIEQTIDPSDKIARHHISKQRYAGLRRESLRQEMTLAEFDERLEEIKAEDEAGIDALLVCAFNRVVHATGQHAFKVEKSLMQRFVSFFV